MKLSLLDRFKIIKYAIKVACSPSTQESLHVIRKHGDEKPIPYMVYPDGSSSTDLIFTYFGFLGGQVPNLDVVNKYSAIYISTIVDYYAKYNNLDPKDFGVMSRPVRHLKDEIPFSEEKSITLNVKP